MDNTEDIEKVSNSVIVLYNSFLWIILYGSHIIGSEAIITIFTLKD